MLWPMSENRRMTLARRPVGAVTPDDFQVDLQPIPEPAEGEYVVKVGWIGFEPAMRGWLNDIPSYVPPVQIGEVMRARGVGEVVSSRNDEYPVGTLVSGNFGWQEFALGGGDGIMGTSKIPAGVPPTAALGVFGTTGLTAYFGLLDVGRPKAGDTVLVSGAAGATGSIVGQIAKLHGCRTIGIAGGPDKCGWVREIAGFDATIDYKSDHVAKKIRELAPDGVDVYFDNVGGPILEAALANIAQAGTIVLCGGISSGYSLEEMPPGPRNLSLLTVRSARMEGFIVLDFARRFGEGVKQLAAWVQEGKITWADDIQHGTIEDCVPTLNRLFEGKNLGKQMLQIAEPTPAPAPAA
jgi:NADPH-dependent curcumin reductase CurA